jgi:hypothetical protein
MSVTPAAALDMARERMAQEGRSDMPRVRTDTSDFFDVRFGDVLLLGDGAYLVRGTAHEGRFGLEEQPKPWVKWAVDLFTGQRVLIKLVFFESFDLTLGDLTYTCFRSPKKEARVLDLVRGRKHFMQGRWLEDEAGNNVRILEVLPGPVLPNFVQNGPAEPHQNYCRTRLPALLDKFIPAVEALDFLHGHGEKHGDVRRDHIFLDPDGNFAWIDFDYNYRHHENLAGLDLFGLGNILAFLVGGGDVTLHDLKAEHPDWLDRLDTGDLNLVFHNRVMNLGALYDYLPPELTSILKRFSAGSDVFYDSAAELADDLRTAVAALKST